ncbi:UDP-GalNAc:beta-1,3-N-acetylgalactosaminyltransferase 2-like isoform X2 [Glandiceps talaboti]
MKIQVKFIIGSRACDFPPALRQDEYECDLLNVTDAVLDKELIAFEMSEVVEDPVNYGGPLGQDFQVNRDIVITRLGVFDSNKDGIQTANLKVKLYDTIGEEEIVSITFNADNQGILIGNFRFKVIEPYVLPKGFKGTITVENFSNEDTANNGRQNHVLVNDGGGIIKFRKTSRYGLIPDQFPAIEQTLYPQTLHHLAGNFMYCVHDGKTVKELISNRDDLMEEWNKKITEEELQIEKEILEHGDILLVDEIDVYRNVPKKLLHLHKWASQHLSFSLLLKTDDDCYIDIERIMEAIDHIKFEGQTKIWWSQFRKHWQVNSYGKWTDLEYTATEYPAFACGSGYVLSADLVHWIANNMQILHPYQGEDISTGIWLAALNPHYVIDDHWQCAHVCHDDMYSLPDNTPQQLHKYWQNKLKCNDPCECS